MRMDHGRGDRVREDSYICLYRIVFQILFEYSNYADKVLVIYFFLSESYMIDQIRRFVICPQRNFSEDAIQFDSILVCNSFGVSFTWVVRRYDVQRVGKSQIIKNYLNYQRQCMILDVHMLSNDFFLCMCWKQSVLGKTNTVLRQQF